MAVMYESQITLKLLIRACLLSFTKGTSKLYKGKWIVVRKLINNKRNYNKIAVTKDGIEYEQLSNDSIWKIEKQY